MLDTDILNSWNLDIVKVASKVTDEEKKKKRKQEKKKTSKQENK